MFTFEDARIMRQIQINRENAKRTIMADRNSMTGITSDDQQVEWVVAFNSWYNADTKEKVVIARITWIELGE